MEGYLAQKMGMAHRIIHNTASPERAASTSDGYGPT
jgi:hypothetical protein